MPDEALECSAIHVRGGFGGKVLRAEQSSSSRCRLHCTFHTSEMKSHQSQTNRPGSVTDKCSTAGNDSRRFSQRTARSWFRSDGQRSSASATASLRTFATSGPASIGRTQGNRRSQANPRQRGTILSLDEPYVHDGEVDYGRFGSLLNRCSGIAEDPQQGEERREVARGVQGGQRSRIAADSRRIRAAFSTA
jgi:hypothetical protein